MMHIDDFRVRDPFIVNENGQFYLLYADETGVQECAFSNFTHLSGPRPLIDPLADVGEIVAWASPQLAYGSFLTVTVTMSDGRCGVRIFACDEYLPGETVFQPYTELLTPPDWDCTDGRLFGSSLIFSRRSEKSSSIYAMPLTRDNRAPAGRPLWILPDGEAATLWFTKTDAPGLGMLYFRRGQACIASASSWTPVGPWMKMHLEIPVSGCHASLFENLDGSFMAAVSTSDGQMRFCYLEWQDDIFTLIPQ